MNKTITLNNNQSALVEDSKVRPFVSLLSNRKVFSINYEMYSLSNETWSRCPFIT